MKALWRDPDERAEAYLNLFTGILGAKVFADLAYTVGQTGSTFNPNPYITAFNEGKRSVVVAILNTIEMAKELPPVAKRPAPEAPEPRPDYFPQEEDHSAE